MSNPPELSPALGAWRNAKPALESNFHLKLSDEIERHPFRDRVSRTGRREHSPSTSATDSAAWRGREKQMVENARNLRGSSSPLVFNILRIWIGDESERIAENAAPRPGDYSIREWQAICSAAAARCGYDPKQLAALCEISLRQLQRQFKAALGTAPRVWLNDLRMAEACRLLVRSNSIKEVAYSLSFKQPSHFTREFKGCFGVTPSQYRDFDGFGVRPYFSTLYPEVVFGKRSH